MAFSIELQRNDSEKNALDKTLVTLNTVNGELKDSTSIINPVFIFEGDLASLREVNYLSVPQFLRSYFVDDIVSYRQNLVAVSCHVDVLSSFKSYIRENKGIVFRQETNWNLYLNDGVLEVYQNPIVTTHEFPNGFDAESYVLALAGRADGGLQPGSGGDSPGVKNCNGLLNYARAQLNKPYWYGTFGQTADATLYENRKAAYPAYYTATDFSSQYGERVHDCVGLIKGYRWSDTPTSAPTYIGAQDVNAAGLYAQCSAKRGSIGDYSWEQVYHAYPGVCVFYANFEHVGVSVGDGTVIEARGHAYGVQQNNLTDRPGFTLWGIPDWLRDSKEQPVTA